MEKLIKEIYKKMEENIEEYYPFKEAYIGGTQWIEISGFRVGIYTGVGYCIEIEKDGKTIYKKETMTAFFNKWGYKFFNLINQQVIKRQEYYEKKEELEKMQKNEELSVFIENGMDKWIDELNGIQKVEGTKEFDEIMQDTKRLKEITQEAQKIHDKYKKPFYNLFS